MFLPSQHYQLNYLPPKIHQKSQTISIENYWQIKKVFKEIIGLNYIDHFSIGIVDPDHNRVNISYTPSILYNACAEGWLRFNGALSRTYYEIFDMFVWDHCYDKRFFNKIKFLMEQRYGLTIGISLVKKINNFHLVYCFGTKQDKHLLFDSIAENKKHFLAMGDHCYHLIKNIYIDYCHDYDLPQ